MAAPRFHVDPLVAAPSVGATLALPERAARHAQVLRLQPGAPVTLFDGRGGQWQAVVDRMGRGADVRVRVQAHEDVERELPLAVTLALGMPANERMDTLVEKATELGAAAIQPLVTERSVLRVAGERAERKQRHWAAVAAAACEQCGRNRVPEVAAPLSLHDWLAALGAAPAGQARCVLSTAQAPGLATSLPTGAASVLLLSGPEGGFTDAELQAAQRAGFLPTSLGTRILRADTAPLAALAWISIGADPW